MKNHFWFDLPKAKRKDYPGEEGSNVIAIGGGLFVSYAGNYVYDKEGLQRHVRQFRSVPRSTHLDEFQFEGRYRPKVPAFGS
jgi:hypothetical protein